MSSTISVISRRKKRREDSSSFSTESEGMEPTVSVEVTGNFSNGTESSFIYNDVELYLVSAILTCLAVIGTAGNSIVICVYNRKKDESVSAFFILTLALVDFATCLFIIPYIIFSLNVDFKTRSDCICKIGGFLLEANLLISALVMVAIAIDRYFCICHPFKRIITVSRAKFLVVCLVVIASAIGVCVSLMYGVYDYEAADWGSLEDGETLGTTEGRKESTPGIYQSEIDVSSSGVDVSLKQNTAGFNTLSDTTETLHAKLRYIIKYNGYCAMNNLTFSMEFRKAFHKFHSSLYLFCFVIVLVLYILIYRSVLLHRNARRHLQKKAHLPLSATSRHSNRTSVGEGSLSTSTTRSPSCEGEVLESPFRSIRFSLIDRRLSPSLSTASAASRADNLKTAGILFVVILVFAASLLPTILMQHGVIPYRRTGFYMYFVNNVANPIIYSFMNRNFREKVKNLISRR